MCGIAGFSFLKPNPKLSKFFLGLDKLLFHRGPENSGYFKNSHLTLLHTRLSIVDIAGGNQPIKSKNYVLIVNGEIYNDLEIRKKNRSYKYITKSDSESILALYDKYGIDGIKKLRGMYAFALYDKKNDHLIIGRDPFGIKPLYFSLVKEGIIFCSEIRPLKALYKKQVKLMSQKVIEYMQLQYCSGTQTIFKGIHRVAPGQVLVIKRGRIIKSIFNNLPSQKKPPKLSDKYINDCILESVSNHLRSEVPYCIFFSGGIDSMLLLYYLRKIKTTRLTAFSILFNNESGEYLEDVTKDFKIDLVKEKFSENDFWDWILFAAENIDEPIADYAILPTFKLASIASQNFKVVITGEGGDELFGGYGRYKKIKRLFFKRNFIPKGAFRNILFNEKFKYWQSELKTLNQFLINDNTSSLQQSQLFDYNNWLPNDLLVKLDRCLMTFSMEGRTPFIDKKLFENLFYAEDSKKIKKGFGKFFIREFLNSKIPNYNAFKRKSGFTVPIYDWIPKKIDWIQALLFKQDYLNDYFSKEELREICTAVRKNKKLAKPLWHIIFFTSWYLVNIIGVREKGNFFDILDNYR